MLAVRFISSKENRIKRLAGILDVKEEEVSGILDKNDKEQRDFFKDLTMLRTPLERPLL